MKFKLFSPLILTLCFQAHSASFDCAKASSFNEKAICSNPILNKLDEQMASLYKEQVKISGDSLKSQQKLWNREVRLCKEEECVLSLYKSRIENLNQIKNNSLSIETIIVREFDIQRNYSVNLLVDRLDYNKAGQFTLTGDIGAASVDFVKSNIGKPIVINYIIEKDCLFCITKVMPFVK
jgi:uncharacterized protein